MLGAHGYKACPQNQSSDQSESFADFLRVGEGSRDDWIIFY